MFARHHLVRGPAALREYLREWTGRNWTLLARAVWASLLLIHAPAFLKVWRAACGAQASEASLVGCAWLTAAMIFFVLKLAGVPWLRFRTDRRSRLAILAAILLIHSGPLGMAPDGALTPSNMPVLGTLVLVAALDRVHQWFQRTVDPRLRRIPRQPRVRRPGEVVPVFAASLSPLIVWALRPPPRSR